MEFLADAVKYNYRTLMNKETNMPKTKKELQAMTFVIGELLLATTI